MKGRRSRISPPSEVEIAPRGKVRDRHSPVSFLKKILTGIFDARAATSSVVLEWSHARARFERARLSSRGDHFRMTHGENART
jgi:hypothetical protein